MTILYKHELVRSGWTTVDLHGWESCHYYPQPMHIHGYLAVYLMPSVQMAFCLFTNWLNLCQEQLLQMVTLQNTASGSYFVQSLSFGHHFNALLYPVDIPVCCSDLKQKKIMCSSSLLLLKLFFLNPKRGKQSRCNLSLNYFYYFSYEKYLFLLSW